MIEINYAKSLQAPAEQVVRGLSPGATFTYEAVGGGPKGLYMKTIGGKIVSLNPIGTGIIHDSTSFSCGIVEVVDIAITVKKS